MRNDAKGAGPGRTTTPDSYGIIAFSHLRWSFVWQRPQQLLSRFAKSHPILFVEEPEFILEPGEAPIACTEHPIENVTVLRAKMPKGSTAADASDATKLL